MARPKKNPVRLSDEELKELNAKTKAKGISDTARMRCQTSTICPSLHI